MNAPWSVQAWEIRGVSERPLRYMHFVAQYPELLFELRRTPVARLRSGLRRVVNRVLPA